MKNILSFKLFEENYLKDVNPFAKEKKHKRGLKFSSKDEAIRSVRNIQEMLDKKQIELKDAIIAAHIMSQRAEFHRSKKSRIKEGGLVWKEFLEKLKKQEG